MGCVFCNVNNLRPRIIKTGQTILVFLADPKLVSGHLVIAPQRHVERMADLTDEERAELLAAVVEYEERIVNQVASGCDIRHHYRPYQEDMMGTHHLHVDLLPREPYDELYDKVEINEHKVFQSLTRTEVNVYKELLK